jgi:hypothetical protein
VRASAATLRDARGRFGVSGWGTHLGKLLYLEGTDVHCWHAGLESGTGLAAATNARGPSLSLGLPYCCCDAASSSPATQGGDPVNTASKLGQDLARHGQVRCLRTRCGPRHVTISATRSKASLFALFAAFDHHPGPSRFSLLPSPLVPLFLGVRSSSRAPHEMRSYSPTPNGPNEPSRCAPSKPTSPKCARPCPHIPPPPSRTHPAPSARTQNRP